MMKCQDFPGSPVVNTLEFPLQGMWVRSLVKELKSHKVKGVDKKEEKKLRGNENGHTLKKTG